MSVKVMEVDEVAAALQSYNVALCYDENATGGISIWSPHRKLPMNVKRAVFKHRSQLLVWMVAGDTRVCPARNYHRPFFRHVGAGRFVCDKCIELDAAIQGTGGQELAS